AAEEKRRRRVEGAGSDRRLLRLLRAAADRFVVKRGEGWTVIAGYPWFTDWGRDAMIALPGLLLSTRRFDIARSVLETFARHVDRGMVPNRFPDEGTEPEYNNVDGTLWFVEAVRAYHEAARDEAFLRQVYPLLVEIVERHLRGTRFGIHADVDGLLSSGEPGQQLTWMDAKVDGLVVTPRSGKPVEVQALWHNALRIVALYAANLGDAFTAARLLALADQARESFGALFWDEKSGYLADVVAPDGTRDLTLRPNQLFALSLHRPLLTGARAASVLRVVEERLLTPYGVRTLDPAHPDYRGRFEGGPAERDAAYHQGTAWPWLLGPLVDAHLAVRGNSPDSRRTAAAWLAPLVDHLFGPGLGLLPEVFDGDPPHRPGGCVAQAWSVGEVLRAVLKTGA
ncbi:MAG TPA: amylo-alpha-1,6-glucosidase, partial [Thermoanaerobaculia bacterium]|nr:amylo-alpha-1,6-glucosidase [Thermoanaerobaculia bacterium]